MWFPHPRSLGTMNRCQVRKPLSKKTSCLGNPFDKESDELIAVHTRNVMDSAVVDTVQNILQIGKSQYDSYVQERLIDRSKRITDPIKKNNLPLLSTLGKKYQSKEKA